MSLCVVCNNKITKNSPGIECSGFCGSSYHANSTCSDVAKTQLSTLNSLPGVKWICPSCRKSRRDRAGSTADAAGSDAPFSGDVSDQGMPAFMRTIKQEMQLLRDSVDFCSDKITDFEQKLLKFNDLFKTVETIKMENTFLKNEVVQLTNRLNNIEQFNRSYNIELQDISEKPGENLVSIVTQVADLFKFKLNTSMIDNIFRVPTQLEHKPKNIIIKFLSKLDRDRFLLAAKIARKELGSGQGFKLDGVTNRFYVNEHLPPHTKTLLKQAKEKAKNKNFKFVWVQNGNVLVRKAENTKIIFIAKPEDLNAL